MRAPGAAAPERLLRRLEWHVVRRLDGHLQGAYRIAFRGTGIDFLDLREYTPDDDVRHIDWNVTARMDEPFVRQYTQDRDLTAWLVLDRSASMRFGPDGHGKDTVVTEVAVVLARLFGQGGNRVGAVLYDNAYQRVIPPSTGRNHLLRLAAEIGSASASRPDGRTTDLDAMLRLAATVARRRALIFVLSDFLGGDDITPALTRLAQRHEVVAIRVTDPVEARLPDIGLALVEDAETGEQVLVDTGDPLFRQRLDAQVAARDEELDQAVRRAGAVAHRLGTGDALVPALVDMARRSRYRRR